MKLEYRKRSDYQSPLELIRKTSDEGIVEGYLTAWDTIDSYKTSFQRGCFKRTFEERGHKIRLVWNHERLAGKVLECREDDYGPFVKVQFNLDTQIGKESFAHVRAGDIDSFSFGFMVIDDAFINKVRTFTEVKVMECGPVVFEANEAAKITDARAEDFDETVAKNEVCGRGWKLINAMEQTIDDIFWDYDNTQDEVMSKVDMAISDFHGTYMAWLSEYYDQFKRSADLTKPGNLIQEAIKSTGDLENVTRETSLTDADLDRLKDGKLLTIDKRSKVLELPKTIQEAHQAQRRNIVEALCTEIREMGFNKAEQQRFSALLGLAQGEEFDISVAFDSIDILSKSIK